MAEGGPKPRSNTRSPSPERGTFHKGQAGIAGVVSEKALAAGRTNRKSLARRGTERLFDHVGVDRNRILDAARIAAREIGCDRNGSFARRVEDDPVARPQILARQLEPAELILLEWIRAGDIGH